MLMHVLNGPLVDRVVQVQVVNRHGDRTPLFNAYAGSAQQRESEEHSRLERIALYAALPGARARGVVVAAVAAVVIVVVVVAVVAAVAVALLLNCLYRDEDKVGHLHEAFPVSTDRVHGDSLKHPHGALSDIGLDQTKAVGESLVRTVLVVLHDCCVTHSFASCQARDYAHLTQHTTARQVHVRTSNFRRTALSAQSILSGLLAGRSDMHGDVRVCVEETGPGGTIAGTCRFDRSAPRPRFHTGPHKHAFQRTRTRLC